MQTRSAPLLRTSGIELEAGSEEYFEVVLDRGDALLEGQVLDAYGQPLAGAQVDLYWRHGKKPVRSNSSRSTITDSMGVFFFSRLGVGSRHLRISAVGHRTTQQILQSGEEWVDVQLALLKK